MYLPFTKQYKVYTTNIPLKKLEDQFIDIAGQSAGSFNEIYCSIKDLNQKKYSFYVVVQGSKIFFPYLRTKLIARLFEKDGKTKVETITKTNPQYIFSIILVTVLAIIGIIIYPSKINQAFINLAVFYLAIGITDIISKKILQGTFERFFK